MYTLDVFLSMGQGNILGSQCKPSSPGKRRGFICMYLSLSLSIYIYIYIHIYIHTHTCCVYVLRSGTLSITYSDLELTRKVQQSQAGQRKRGNGC